MPGGQDSQGRRNLRPEDPTRIDRPVPLDFLRGGADSVDGTTIIQYEFPETWEFNGNTFFNLITPPQEQRFRETLELYSQYLGVQFVEVTGGPTQDQFFSLVVGDLAGAGATSGPGNVAVAPADRNGDGVNDLGVMDFRDFEQSVDDTFGEEFSRGTMLLVGQLLGYGFADSLPQPVTQSTDFVFQPGNDNERAFPANADILHGQYLQRPDRTDVDLYRFELTRSGSISLQTVAERLENSSVLDTHLRLYRQMPTGEFEEIAQNDDYFSNDSLIELHLDVTTPTTFVLGVSASGNDTYDPRIEDSGFGGRSEGEYELRMTFRPDTDLAVNGGAPNQLVDNTGVALDGDNDGVPGGVHNFWFQPSTRIIYVDKATPGFGLGNGAITSPFRNLDDALASAQPGDTVRVIANGGSDGRIETRVDNLSYQIGFDSFGLPLADGATLEVPQDVNLVIDAGAIFKMRRARVGVGSVAPLIDRSGGTLQLLGAPTVLGADGVPVSDGQGNLIANPVIFTSYNDPTAGLGNQLSPSTPPQPGDWGGLDFRGDLDTQDETRTNREAEGNFINRVQYSELTYGGGQVVVNGRSVVVAPVDTAITRPTVVGNTITQSADAAIAATPDSFAETRFDEPLFRAGGDFTSDYVRIGPDIYGNTVIDNSINGLFVRVRTRAGDVVQPLTSQARFDDTDIVHVVAENLLIQGTPGGPLSQGVAPASLLVRSTPAPGDGDVTIGTFRYRLTFVDASGVESAASVPTTAVTTTQIGGINLSQLPVASAGGAFVARNLYRSFTNPNTGVEGPFELVANLNGSSTTFTDRAATGGRELSDLVSPLQARLDARLAIDPGIILKMEGARIEVQFGGQLLAEGTAQRPIVITSLEDQRYGTGGTFDTNNRGQGGEVNPGDWGGIYLGHSSQGSLDHVTLAGGGGTTRIEGGFASFNVLEVHQADVRIANSTFEQNADGRETPNGERVGRTDNSPAQVFVRAAQPTIVNNIFRDGQAVAVSFDTNALNGQELLDRGRSRGGLDAVESAGNTGALIRGNQLENNTLNGIQIRGGEITTEVVWDDTDIVHIVTETIEIPNQHIYGGLRLQSRPGESLVVKFANSTEQAGIVAGGDLTTAANELADITDRIGGALQVVGVPDFPVVLTSLEDDFAGAGFTTDGRRQVDTNNDGILGQTEEDGAVVLLPTGDEVDNGTLIDNDVDNQTPGFFAANITQAGEVQGSGVTVTSQGNLLADQDFIFDYDFFVYAAGQLVDLNANITQPPTLVGP
ncbi:MAG: peptidase, partial [Planctomycetota bacterium]